jgi:hypothetical protein
MKPEKAVREIVDQWNAKAKAVGLYLDRDPWSIPPGQGSLLDVPQSAEGQARIARLQQQIADMQRQPSTTTASHSGAIGEVTQLGQALLPKEALIEEQPHAPDHS